MAQAYQKMNDIQYFINTANYSIDKNGKIIVCYFLNTSYAQKNCGNDYVEMSLIHTNL